jgi:hypothetical protein
MLADQYRLMTAIASMTMDSAITMLCYQCGKVTHTDKMLADQCRLMTAILGKGWGRVDSKQADMSKVERYGPTKGTEPITRTTLAMQAAKEAMAKPEDDRNDCPDEDTSDKEERPATKTAPTYPFS